MPRRPAAPTALEHLGAAWGHSETAETQLTEVLHVIQEPLAALQAFHEAMTIAIEAQQALRAELVAMKQAAGWEE